MATIMDHFKNSQASKFERDSNNTKILYLNRESSKNFFNKRNYSLDSGLKLNRISTSKLQEINNSNFFMIQLINNISYIDLNNNFTNEEAVFENAVGVKRNSKYHKFLISALDNNKEISKIFKFDFETKTRIFVDWSGEEILNCILTEEKVNYFNKIIKNIEIIKCIIWPEEYIYFN